MKPHLSFLAMFALFGLYGTADGQMFLKPSGDQFSRLVPKGLDAKIVIEHQIASTHLTYTFANPTQYQVETEFVYVVPPQAVVTGFAYWYGNERVEAKVARKERAREVYEAIVSRQKDPAIIELIGKRTFRARIFPILPEADLKIEIDMVQVVPGTAARSNFVLPIKMSKGEKLEKLSAEVLVKGAQAIEGIEANHGLKATQIGDSYRVAYAGKMVRPIEDLRVSIRNRRSNVRVEVLSARSGGPSGFFAVVLSASHGLVRPSVRIVGAKVYSLHQPKLSRLAAGKSLLITGRYGAPAPVLIEVFEGSQRIATVSETMTNAVHPNHAGVKLWAADEIERLGNREAEIVPLSIRHTLPSKFTSWIAIPLEERARVRELDDQKRVATLVKSHTELILKGLAESDESKLLDKTIKKMISRYDGRLDPFVDQAYYDVLDPLATNYARTKYALYPDTSKMSKLWQKINLIEPYCKETVSYTVDEAIRRYAGDIAFKYGKEYITARGQAKKLSDLKAQLDRLKLVGGNEDQIRWKVSEAMQSTVIEEYVTKTAEGNENEARKLLDLLDPISQEILYGNLAYAIEAEAENRVRASLKKSITTWRMSPSITAASRRLAKLGYFSAEQVAFEVRRELARDELNRSMLVLDRDNLPTSTRRREQLRVRQSVDFLGTMDGAEWNLPKEARDLYDKVSDRPSILANSAEVKRKLEPFAQRYGLHGVDLLRTLIYDRVQDVIWRSLPKSESSEDYIREYYYDRPTDLLTVQDCLSVLECTKEELLKTRTPRFPARSLRNELVSQFKRGRNPKEIQSLVNEFREGIENYRGPAKKDYADWRVERLYVQTLLEKLEATPATPEIIAERNRLFERRTELYLKMGDPLITVALPSHTDSAVAYLPWGEMRPLYRKGDLSWQGRFDVPPSAIDGQQVAIVVAAGRFGIPTFHLFPFQVDNVTPTLSTSRDRRSQSGWVINPNESLARLKLIDADGTVRSLARNIDDTWRFDRPALGVHHRLVATDIAHNLTVYDFNSLTGQLSKVIVKPDLLPSHTSLWQLDSAGSNVQSLSTIGDQLLVGTLEEGATGPDSDRIGFTGSVPRRGISCGAGEFIRQANGELYQCQNGQWQRIHAPSKRAVDAITTDGHDLVVAHYGGFSIFDGKGWTDCFDLPELAGYSPTAIAANSTTIWIGLQGVGIAEIDRLSHRVTVYNEGDGLPDDWVTTLEVADAGLFAGTFADGAVRLVNGRFERVAGTQGACITGMAADRGRVWISSRSGVWCASATGVVRITLPKGETEAQAITVHQGTIWIGTRTSLYRSVVDQPAP